MRKLHWMLSQQLAAAGVKVGRDRMFEELRARDLLVPPLPAHPPRTTQSRHALPVFQNLIKGRRAGAPNEWLRINILEVRWHWV